MPLRRRNRVEQRRAGHRVIRIRGIRPDRPLVAEEEADVVPRESHAIDPFRQNLEQTLRRRASGEQDPEDAARLDGRERLFLEDRRGRPGHGLGVGETVQPSAGSQLHRIRDTVFQLTRLPVAAEAGAHRGQDLLGEGVALA